MSKKANPAAIGIFVVGSIVLATIATIMFGSGQFFSKKKSFIIYCQGSVNGLEIGAPVKLKGIKIGQVSKMYIRHNQIDESFSIPVIIELDTTRLQTTLGLSDDLSDPKEFNEEIISGLRARLQLSSFVTGLLYVELDYYPQAGLPVFIQRPDNKIYLEIPTIQSDFLEVFTAVSTIVDEVKQVDLKGSNLQITRFLSKLESSLDNLDVGTLNDELVATLQSTHALLSNPEIHDTITTLNSTLKAACITLNRLDGKIDPLFDDIDATTTDLREALNAFTRLGGSANSLVQSDSPLVRELEASLREIGEAANSIRVLVEFLEQNPSALLTGKQAGER